MPITTRDLFDFPIEPFNITKCEMPSPKLYSPADIMKALPVVLTLWYKPFKELKQMYRAKGGPQLGRHINKRECIMFIAFGEHEARALADATPDSTPTIEANLEEAMRKLATLDIYVKDREEKLLMEKHTSSSLRGQMGELEADKAALLRTMRQLMHS